MGGQNGIQVLGLWTFVLEEFGDNVPNYISSLDYIDDLTVDIKTTFHVIIHSRLWQLDVCLRRKEHFPACCDVLQYA